MKLPKAIEILQAIRHTGHYQPTLDDVDAIELGIEALKRIEYTRKNKITMNWKELPGETE